METTLNAQLDDKIRSLPGLVNTNAWLVHRGRFVNLDFVIQIDCTSYYVTVQRGVLGVSADKRLTPAYAFALRGSASTWEAFWHSVPRPPFHDIFAMSHLADFRIEGDLRPLMANLIYFKEVLA